MTAHLVLANDNAGSTARAAVATAVAALAEHGPTELRWTSSPEEFAGCVGDADDGRTLVVAGGDGSIHLALNSLAELGRTEAPVGIIPLGTGNDFARNHRLPLDPAEAAQVVIEGTPTSIDAIELTHPGSSQLVANNLHAGLGVAAAQTASRLKRALHRFAYPVATAYEGVAGGPEALRIDIDGATVWDGPLLAVLALLGPSMGGGVELVETSETTIDVVAVGPVPRRERVALVRHALSGEVTDSPDAQRWSGAAVTIERVGSGRDLRLDIDGELAELASPVRLELRSGAWTVLTPA